MFKAHILVSEETDVAAESAKIAAMAVGHLNDSQIFVLVRDVEAVLADLKQQDSETAVHGIRISAKKIVATKDYSITLELRPRNNGSKKSGFLTRLFGR